MRLKTIVASLSVTLAVVAASVGVASPASAATGKNGVLEAGEFGLFYLSDQSGYVFDLFVADSNFFDDVFPGTNISADNNTESYWNRDSLWWDVFTGANYMGSHGCLPPGYVGNASATFRNTISSAQYGSGSC